MSRAVVGILNYDFHPHLAKVVLGSCQQRIQGVFRFVYGVLFPCSIF